MWIHSSGDCDMCRKWMTIN